MRVLVLGGYGFIGAEVARALVRRGHEVVGLGREAALGARLMPGARWIGADLASLTRPEDWTAHVAGVDAIVNAAGALQDGARDDLDAVHHRAVVALVGAAERAGVRRLVQISAVGASSEATTAFLRTKAAGDRAVRESALDWIVFRPGLVVGRNAYGGTALLRALAGAPLIEALAFPEAPIQTVSIDDVADAVLRAVGGDVPMRADYDLVEERSRTLREVVGAFRAWLGFEAPRIRIAAPDAAAAIFARLADAAGRLGWRSPLRTTAMRVMRDGVRGDSGPWRAILGSPLATLDETLAMSPATAQERIFARMSAALPVIVLTLALFWIVSGLIGVLRLDAASTHWPFAGGRPAVLAGASADIAVGLGLVMRRFARRAALAGAALGAFYLAAGTVIAPDLWLDPLGAYVKVGPAIVLSLTLALMLEPR